MVITLPAVRVCVEVNTKNGSVQDPRGMFLPQVSLPTLPAWCMCYGGPWTLCCPFHVPKGQTPKPGHS